MSTTTDRQQTFQFTPGHETREQRMRRILAGVPGVRRASEHRFDYHEATALHKRLERQAKEGKTVSKN